MSRDNYDKEITATAQDVLDFAISSNVRENKATELFEIVTVIKFATRTDPQTFINILRAGTQGVPIECIFKSKQLELDINSGEVKSGG